MRLFVLLALFFIPLVAQAEPSEEIRRKYTEQILSAFQLQSIGRSTMSLSAM